MPGDAEGGDGVSNRHRTPAHVDTHPFPFEWVGRADHVQHLDHFQVHSTNENEYMNTDIFASSMQVNLTKVTWYYGLRHPRPNQVVVAAADAILTAAHHLHVTFL